MALYAGIDVGAQSIKVVIFDGKNIIGKRFIITEEESNQAALVLYNALMSELGLTSSDVYSVFVTGWGAGDVTFADGKSAEQVCAAKGARFLIPTARTVLDMGAEGCRVMRLDQNGMLEEFTNNSKCASGTGSFIELGAVYLRVSIEDMGPLSLAADGAAEVSSTCAVFAESVIISNIHKGESIERIAAGIHKSAATRISELLGRTGIVDDVVFLGGPALNKGLVMMLEKMNRISIKIPDDPRTVVALGAAIQASIKKHGRR